MKEFIKAFFNKKEEGNSNENQSGKYMPEPRAPIEERFTYNFNETESILDAIDEAKDQAINLIRRSAALQARVSGLPRKDVDACAQRLGQGFLFPAPGVGMAIEI